MGDAPSNEVYETQLPSKPTIRISGKKLFLNDLPVLLDVPESVTLMPAGNSALSGHFLGVTAEAPASRHVASIGKLRSITFSSIFRFKAWWSTLWVGTQGSDLEIETQFLLLNTPEKPESGGLYLLILPLIDAGFAASIQAGTEDNVDICVESGTSSVISNDFPRSAYINSGSDPYLLVKESMRELSRRKLGNFRLLEDKNVPEFVDRFGWCTWDAFYLSVEPEGVLRGVEELTRGGCPPGFLVIDDGWQSISTDQEPDQEAESLASADNEMACRLAGFQENVKFQNYFSGERREGGFRGFVKDLKGRFENLDYVYVWHALCGYWGGVRPGKCGVPARILPVKRSPGLKGTMEDRAESKMVLRGIGAVPSESVRDLYEGMYSYLSQVGIDGVKVDAIQILEALGEELGGRVHLTNAYYSALNAAANKYFKGNGVSCSMQNSNDFLLLGTNQIAVARAGDDFWTEDPCGDPEGSYWLQGCHIVHCAYNSVWMGHVVLPDWDMFLSTHQRAHFHAAARAISGGPIYVSDRLGQHDLELLKKLVLPDSTLLRCVAHAQPTRDCLFINPLHPHGPPLKLWNINRCTGVVGAFSCDGGEWCRVERRFRRARHSPERAQERQTTACYTDVDVWRTDAPSKSFIALSHLAEKLTVLSAPDNKVPIGVGASWF
ncbi:galactinol--sucrose galactosyltransferase [Amborella trichopoda]|uniref:galactinol--sucrose galactosyltransferase n=1 Tax=Amborella trichopoda TaxID=13333 RepID=UPI0005D43D03|nr:galactinol--sucrose galactosyltransferase [Amborella trichopoda]|eukprot:XP_011626341.1 galactinol--sucrose galactosyltransferase [Amborella trichopoda]